MNSIFGKENEPQRGKIDKPNFYFTYIIILKVTKLYVRSIAEPVFCDFGKVYLTTVVLFFSMMHVTRLERQLPVFGRNYPISKISPKNAYRIHDYKKHNKKKLAKRIIKHRRYPFKDNTLADLILTREASKVSS